MQDPYDDRSGESIFCLHGSGSPTGAILAPSGDTWQSWRHFGYNYDGHVGAQHSAMLKKAFFGLPSHFPLILKLVGENGPIRGFPFGREERCHEP